MSEEKKDKTKQVSWAGLLLAFFAAVTSVGDGIRACNEREANQQDDVKADIARVDADKKLKENTQSALVKLQGLHDEDYDELSDRLEEQDKQLFKLRTLLEAQDRLIQASMGIDAGLRDQLLFEALAAEAQEEDIFIPPPVHEELPPLPEEVIEKTAEKMRKKKRGDKKREERPKPEFLFDDPEPAYLPAQIQQFQQQTQQQLPPAKAH